MALEAGKHVLVEKPMAVTGADARKMRDTAERTGKNEIRYVVTVVQPDGSSVFIKDVWYGIG